mmetsp:Transcript_79325/g.227551  ORF Transcript_79325/g.227551 Transcript_79325/m.227551 type:complete len:210 (+) Transcript_79325:302-931(+)
MPRSSSPHSAAMSSKSWPRCTARNTSGKCHLRRRRNGRHGFQRGKRKWPRSSLCRATGSMSKCSLQTNARTRIRRHQIRGTRLCQNACGSGTSKSGACNSRADVSTPELPCFNSGSMSFSRSRRKWRFRKSQKAAPLPPIMPPVAWALQPSVRPRPRLLCHSSATFARPPCPWVLLLRLLLLQLRMCRGVFAEPIHTEPLPTWSMKAGV